ncbi:Wzz/FepE/Etk N-terminal domain-containing protein [Flavobacterium myungsuense]|uniref:Wzz/FepE/Etk N-terminal domain-containing protein n=1 Tax=Flavobacterium myungsuense TaxID=651823 RepID=UPI0036405A20
MENFEFENQANVNDFDLLGEINKYLKYWYLFLFSVLFFFIIAKIYLRYTTPIFESKTQIKILDNSSSAFKLPENMISIFGGKSNKRSMDNEIEMIKSYQLMERVVKKLDLTTRYYRVGYFTSKELWPNHPFTVNWLKSSEQLQNKSLRIKIEVVNNGYIIIDDENNLNSNVIKFNSIHILSGIPFKISTKYNYKEFLGKVFIFELLPLKQTALYLSKAINVGSGVGQSDILNLTLTGENSSKVEATLNEIVKQFDLDGIKDRQLVSQRTIDFVNNRFNFLGSQLDSIETDKEKYKQVNGLTNVDTDISSASKDIEAARDLITNVNNQIELTKYIESTLKSHKNSNLFH